MAQVIIRLRSFPPQAQLTAAKLGMMGFGEGSLHYDVNHALADLTDPTKTLQVRDISERAPARRVGHYVEILKPYTLNRANMLMPPVVYSGDGVLLDGNTRDAAARKLGWMSFPAIVLHDNYNGAPQAMQDQMLKIAGLLNTTHGKDLPPGDIERLVLQLARDKDTSPADLARQLQVSRTTVKGILYARDARSWADELGIDVSGETFTRSHLTNLGTQADSLTAPVFTAILNLIQETGMSANDERTLIKDLKSLRTEPAKLERIAAERASLDGVTKGYATKPSAAARMRQALGNVNNHEPGDLVETVPANSAVHKAVIITALTKLEEALRLQLELDGSRT